MLGNDDHGVIPASKRRSIMQAVVPAATTVASGGPDIDRKMHASDCLWGSLDSIRTRQRRSHSRGTRVAAPIITN